MTCSRGFTILEILLAMAITAMLSTLLYNSFWQVQRTVRTLQNVVDINRTAHMTFNQLEKDINTAFVPWHTIMPTTTVQQPKAPGQKSQRPEKLATVFVGANEKNQLRELNFITTNALNTYQETKPRLVRVVYQLKPGEAPGTFILTRAETNELDIEKLKEKKPRSFVIADNIKQLKLEYVYTKKEEKKNEQSEQKSELIKLPQWNLAQDESGSMPGLPAHVHVDLTLWDDQQQGDKEFNLVIPLFHHAMSKNPPQPPRKITRPAPRELTAEQKKMREDQLAMFEQIRNTPSGSTIKLSELQPARRTQPVHATARQTHSRNMVSTMGRGNI